MNSAHLSMCQKDVSPSVQKSWRTMAFSRVYIGKRPGVPMEREPNLWLPGPLTTEGKGAPRQGKGHQTSGCPGRSLWREKAHRARGKGAKPLAAWAARRGGKRHAAPGENALKPLAPRAARRGGKRRAAPGERPPKLQAAWPEHGECSPHTATSACSAPPSPQQD